MQKLKLCLIAISIGLVNQSYALSQTKIDKMMREMASNTAAHLPVRIDKRTMWISTGYIAGELHHTYEIAGVRKEHLVEKSRIRSAQIALEKEKINLYCTHPEMAVLRKYNIPIVYNYVTDTGIFILRAFTSNSSC